MYVGGGYLGKYKNYLWMYRKMQFYL